MKEVPLTQGYVAFVDDADFETVNAFKWRVHKAGRRRYALRKVPKTKGKMISLHRFLMPEVARIGHVNENGLDNQRSNLRPWGSYQNLKTETDGTVLSKVCRDCRTDKPASDFYPLAGSKDGLQYQCKECDLRRSRARAVTHYAEIRASHIKRKYNLTYPEYEAILEKQHSKCAICKRDFDLISRKKTNDTPCVDHCHASGKTRSLLCQPCNRLLGDCLENPKILLCAINYLTEHKTETTTN